MLNLGGHNSFSGLVSACLRLIDHLNLKLWIFSGHTASFKTWIPKVQDFGNLNFQPCNSDKCHIVHIGENKEASKYEMDSGDRRRNCQ